MRCNNCGNENAEASLFCEKCGLSLSAQQNNEQPLNQPQPQDVQPTQQSGEQPTPPQQTDFYGQPQQNAYYGQQQNGFQGYNGPPPQYMPPPNQGYYAGPQENSKSAVPALVFGILSILCGGVLWLILSIVFGLKGIREQKERGLPTTMPMTGLVLGIIGAVIWAIILVFLLPVYLDALSSMQILSSLLP